MVVACNNKIYKSQIDSTISRILNSPSLNEVDSPPVKRARLEAVVPFEAKTTLQLSELQLTNCVQNQSQTMSHDKTKNEPIKENTFDNIQNS